MNDTCLGIVEETLSVGRTIGVDSLESLPVGEWVSDLSGLGIELGVFPDRCVEDGDDPTDDSSESDKLSLSSKS